MTDADLRKWSQLIRERDANTCQLCSRTERLESHHCRPKAIYPDYALLLDNGVTLCFNCHRSVVHAGMTFDLGNWRRFMPMWRLMMKRKHNREFNALHQDF